MKTKVCSKCKLEKPISNFHKNITKFNGVESRCKVCRCEDAMEYHLKHKDENNKRCREYSNKHKEDEIKRHREYYQKHKEERLQKQKEYYQKNRDDRCKYMRKIYYPTHREDCLGYLHNWREENKDLLYDGQKRYRQSENGKIAFAKVRSKRKRNLGFNILFENILDEPIVWHHIDKKNVVAVPKDLHELFGRGQDIQRHREYLFPIVQQLYPI